MSKTVVPARSGRKLRTSVALAAAAAVTGSLAACSGGGSSPSGVQNGTLQMYTWVGSDSDREQWKAWIDAGAAVDQDVKVDFSGPPIGDYYTKLPTVLSGNNAPCLITLQNGQVNQYVEALEPLGPRAEKAGVDLGEYDRAMIEQLSVDGEVYALPFDATPAVVFYNKKLFRQAGVPEPALNWTTDEFLEAAEATTGDGVHGFAIGQGITPMVTLMTANGESYVDDSREANFDDPALAERFQFLVDLAREHEVAQPLEASGGSFPDMDLFNTGQAAMSMNGLWALQTHREALGAENVGIATVPVDSGVSHGYIGGTGLAMTKTCSDKDAAFDAITAMTSAEAQASIARSRNGVPSRAAVLDTWAESIGSDRAADVVRSLSEHGQATPTPVDLNQINTLITQYEVKAFSGASTVEQVLDRVDAALGE